MRLAQLARKLAVRPGEIVAFLEAKDIPAEKGSNFRLEDDQVELILKHFGIPGDQWSAGAKTDTLPPDDPAGDPEVQPGAVAGIATAGWDATEGAEALRKEEEIKVIKAPKVELPGLTVLGKIELPGPRTGSQPANDDAEISKTPTPDAIRSGPGGRRRKYGTDAGRSGKNPVTLQREREAREAEKGRRAAKALEKERRRQKYLNKVIINVPTKPARIYDEEVVELQQEAAEPRPGPWGRFLRWLHRE